MAVDVIEEKIAQIDVVAAVIKRNGRYLICKRQLHKHHGGLWEFPGGKVQTGESHYEAVDREIREELGITSRSTGSRLFSGSEEKSVYVIHFIECEVFGEPRRLEHAEIYWAAKDELHDFCFAPVDRLFVDGVLLI